VTHPVEGGAVSLTLEDVRWVAHLARLELTEAEQATMARQLDAILTYMSQLQEVSTEGVEPLAHPLPIHSVFRADEPAPSLPVEVALVSAPRRDGDFFGVPAVLD